MVMLTKVSELKDLEVISMWDGRRLGPILDIEIDLDEGAVKALVLSEDSAGGLPGFFRKSKELIVSWDRIYRIGADTILIQPHFANQNEG
jgi:YlmC/YmxH family sporulation protein